MLASIAFIALCAAANRIRGGVLDDFLGTANNTGIRVISAGIVGVAAYFLLYPMLIAAIAAVVFFLFHLPGWGAWFDIGTKAPEPDRGQFLPRMVYQWASGFGDAVADTAAMVARGLYSIIIFVPFAWVNGSPALTLFAIPYALLWTLCYVIAHRWRIPVHPEISSGALFGLAIVMSA